MQRFFVSFPLSVDVVLTDTDIIHQLTRVLRSQIGDYIVLFDGDGSEYEYTISAIEKKQIHLRGVGRIFPRTEPKKYITLYQALPNKHEKIEYILQKGVEVGIARFVFFRSDRSQRLVVSPSKRERFSLIAREALEQCGGLKMPEIEFVDEGMGRSDISTNLVLDTTGTLAHCSDLTLANTINLWVGPEGGWSDAERSKMSYYGFTFVRFGERVLRTETAGVVSAFALLYA